MKTSIKRKKNTKIECNRGIKKCDDAKKERWITLFMEVVVALKAAAEAINGLACFPDPESYGVDCSS